MQHELILNDTVTGAAVGIAKVDMTKDRQNVSQKQVTVNHFSFFDFIDGTDAVVNKNNAEKRQLQYQIERFTPSTTYIVQDLVDKLNTINVAVILDTQVLPITIIEEVVERTIDKVDELVQKITTTTTTSKSTTTTTTLKPTTTTTTVVGTAPKVAGIL